MHHWLHTKIVDILNPPFLSAEISPRDLRLMQTDMRRHIVAAELDLPNHDHTRPIGTVQQLVHDLKHITRQLQLAGRFFTFASLSTWSQMNGCLGAVEALHRDKQEPQDMTEVWQLNLLTANMIRGANLLASDSFPAYISLASTARKLLFLHMGLGVDPKTGSHNSQLRPQEFNTMHATTMIKALGDSVSAIENLMQRAPASRISGSSSQATRSARTTTSNVSGNSSSQETRLGTALAVKYKPPSAHTLMHQLQAIQVSTLIQVCHWRLVDDRKHQLRQSLTTPGWLQSEQADMKVAVGRDMAALISTLLDIDIMISPAAQLVVNATWERYAITHFDGKLTPGCGCMGCTNLGGVSEAAVCTRLCSGCRKTRYCSVQCQKVAWLWGGHSLVCRR